MSSHDDCLSGFESCFQPGHVALHLFATAGAPARSRAPENSAAKSPSCATSWLLLTPN
jgi:hypothetical protein